MDSLLPMNVLLIAVCCIIIPLIVAFSKKDKSSKIKNSLDSYDVARTLLVFGFIITGISTAMLFFTQQETNTCIVNSLKNLQTDLQNCLKYSLVDGTLIITSTIGFSAMTISSAIALRKKPKDVKQAID